MVSSAFQTLADTHSDIYLILILDDSCPVHMPSSQRCDAIENKLDQWTTVEKQKKWSILSIIQVLLKYSTSLPERAVRQSNSPLSYMLISRA